MRVVTVRFLTKFALALVLPAFVPAEPFPPLATVSYAGANSAPVVAAGDTFKCTPTAVYDGDGPIWCAEGPKIRIAGVAAREMDGTYRRNQPCPTISAIDARDRLVRLFGGPRGTLPTGHVLLVSAPMTCRSEGSAGGSRTAAWCISPAMGDLSCAAVRAGGAVQWPHYWRDHKCK
jgi:endonuclease YncB( thermonuclease family)